MITPIGCQGRRIAIGGEVPPTPEIEVLADTTFNMPFSFRLISITSKGWFVHAANGTVVVICVKLCAKLCAMLGV